MASIETMKQALDVLESWHKKCLERDSSSEEVRRATAAIHILHQAIAEAKYAQLVAHKVAHKFMIEDYDELEDSRHKVVKILSLSIVLIYVLSSIAIFVREFF
jgi:hypothetical protein